MPSMCLLAVIPFLVIILWLFYEIRRAPREEDLWKTRP